MHKLISLIIILITVSQIFAQHKRKIPKDKPKLIIGIVVEQMRYEYINRFWNKFEKKGFKRLINEGTFCKNTNINYMFTQTAPGIASIYTGTTPSVHGIVANDWYTTLTNKEKKAVYDRTKNTIGAETKQGRCSPKNLLTTTVSDEIIKSNKLSKCFSISMDERSAVLGGGHLANGCFWWDDESGNWITSDYYYQDSLPTWVSSFNSKGFHETYLSKTWNTLQPLNEYDRSRSDTTEYEYGIGKKRQNTFPYNLAEISNIEKKNKDYSILKTVPYGNNFTKDFAIATIVNEELGKDEHTDFISISFSATENIGQRFGPMSVEIEDTYLRIDKELTHFLTFIDENIGKENVLIFLTSNHGVAEIPKYMEEMRIPAGKFNALYSVALLKSYLNAIYGENDWVTAYTDQQIYLNHNIIEDSQLSLSDVQKKAASFLLQFDAVANAITADQMMQTNFSDGIFAKMQNSFNQKRSGDIMINLKPGYIEDVTYSTYSNSPYTYDTHVPLIWYGWKIKHKTILRDIDITDIAPTISSLLNISFPNGYSGKPIFEIW